MTCKWIERSDHVEAIRNGDDVSAIYCGATCLPGSSWCPRHRAQVYRPATAADRAHWRAALAQSDRSRARK